MTKVCLEIKRTLSCVYYELKYYYNYYFCSKNNSMNDYNYAPLQEIVIDSQPVNNIPKRYTSPPPFNTLTSKIIPLETFPKIGITENIRKRPSIDFLEATNVVLSPISEKSDDNNNCNSALNSPNIKIEITDTDLKCSIESDSDDTWELLTDKSE